MSWRRLGWLALLANAVHCHAGHGLINSFAGIEWLPEAGSTPADWWYRGERLLERTELAAAATDAARLALLQVLARERIAECEALVRLGDPTSMALAVTAYEEHLAAVDAILAGQPESIRGPRLLAWATTLLEHRYIISTDYLDLPRATRRVLGGPFDIAAEHYAAIRAQLPRRLQESLFFKEEEVRWSWAQAQGADAQGL